MSMESASSSPSSTLVGWEYLVVRPVLAVVFVLSFISLWWWLAWKLVLVHVPLVQEIFRLKENPVGPKPPTGRLTSFYERIDAHNLASQCGYPECAQDLGNSGAVLYSYPYQRA